jgi:hypothetical protein
MGFDMGIKHSDRHENFEMSTASFAIAMVPMIILSSGITTLMTAKAYRSIRLTNAKAKRIERRHRL